MFFFLTISTNPQVYKKKVDLLDCYVAIDLPRHLVTLHVNIFIKT